jgi:hypothetical protein
MTSIPFIISSVVAHLGAEVQSVGSDLGAIAFDCDITYFPHAEEMYCNLDMLDDKEYLILLGICSMHNIELIEHDEE